MLYAHLFSPFRAYGRLGGNIRQPSPLLVSSSPLLKIGTDAVLRCYLNMRLGACKRLLCYLFLELGTVTPSLMYLFVLHIRVLVDYTHDCCATQAKGGLYWCPKFRAFILASDSLELGQVRLLMRANLIALFFLAFFYNAEDQVQQPDG